MKTLFILLLSIILMSSTNTAAGLTAPTAVNVPLVVTQKACPPVNSRKLNLYKILHRHKFRGKGLRMAYAIAMRESGGNPQARAPRSGNYNNGTHDSGLFQFNSRLVIGWHLSWSRLFDGDYQANVVYVRTKNMARNTRPWGLNPDGSFNSASFSGWSSWQVRHWIVIPYTKNYNQFPAVQAAAICRGVK